MVLAALKIIGVELALDDFGIGNSSLSALLSYPFDVVKIDRSFLERVQEDRASARVFAAILGVIRAAELQAVAEGIENADQLALVRDVGCDAAQGFLLAEPAAGEEILPHLAVLPAPPGR